MPHALIVDDDASSVMLLSRMLADRGFTTRVAGSLAEARDSLDPRPDSCLVELKLPDGEGIALLDDGLGERAGSSSSPATRRSSRAWTHDAAARRLPDQADRWRSSTARSRATSAGREGAGASTLIGRSPEMQRLARTIGASARPRSRC
jgi:DNA-binding NtrC family response regulator